MFKSIPTGGILSTIGDTPLLKLERLYADAPVRLFGKLEAVNPGGSIKDRTALSILTHALESGALQRGATVIESSSGNMAIGLAQACKYLGLQLIAVVDPKVNRQTVQILRAYGAHIEHVTDPLPGGSYLDARLQRVQELLDTIPGSYWTNQYANPYNPIAHHETMREIVEALDGELDYLFAATSTCGTIMGCAQYVEEAGLETRIIAVDAVGSVIFGGPKSERLIPGHGAGRPSELLDCDFIDRYIKMSDRDCVLGCRRLIEREAILAGGSSGAVVSAVEHFLPEIPPGSTCALIFCDRGERYLETIYSDEWVREHFGEVNFGETALDESTAAFPAHNGHAVLA